MASEQWAYIRKARECVNIFGGRNLARGPKVVKNYALLLHLEICRDLRLFRAQMLGAKFGLESCHTHILKKVPCNNLREKNAFLGAIFSPKLAGGPY